MTDTATELSLTVSRTISAPPEAVFDAWLDPAMLTQFMLPGKNTSCPSAETDGVEGGRFAITMCAGETAIPHAGTYLVIDRPKTLSFTWETPFSVEGSTVTLTFAPDGDGTRVTIDHIRFPSEESRGNHEAGWGAILAALDALL